MSTELERRLNETLTRQSQESRPGPEDPWVTFTARERRHRRQRVARRMATGVVGAGLAAAITVGVAPVPGFVPGFDISAASAHPLLADEPTRGSLAGDPSWLNGLRRTVGEDDDGWRVVGRDKIQIHFAGEVPGARVALVTYRIQKGLRRDRVTSWYVGAAGAAPAAMELMSAQDPEKVSTLMTGSDERPGYLVVVAPPGSDVRVSLGTTYGADGRVHPTTWIPGTADSLAVVPVPASPRAPVTTVQVTRNKHRLYDGPAQMSWSATGETVELPAPTVRRALAASPGTSTVDLATATAWTRDALNGAGLDPATTGVRIPWTGTLHGRSAALIELKPTGGGRLYFGYSGTPVTSEAGTSFEWQPNLRLLVPAQDADTRPILWRDWAVEGRRPSSTVNVILAEGTARAELVLSGGSGGKATPITPDAKGYAVVQVPVGAKASVRAYDDQGGLLGETALPELRENKGQIVGSTRDTRLVD